MKKRTYDVIIIGGGIIGCSLAFELEKQNAGTILVLEKKYLTAGATGRCNAGFREFWSTDLYVDLSQESIEIYEHLNEYTGYPYDCEVIRNGYFFPIYNECIENYESIIKFQNMRGIPTTVINAREMKHLVPSFNTEGVQHVIWSKRDGNANPFQCTFAYALGAQKRGVEIITKCDVKDIIVRNQEVKGVVTNKGVFESECIYNCTNSDAPQIAAKVGDELPIQRVMRQTLITERMSNLGGKGAMLPMIINMENGCWIKQSPSGTLMLGKAENDTQENGLGWDFMERASALNVEMLPALHNSKIIRQYEGFYDVSTDYAPIISKSANARGLTHVCGFSGHGFMIAPKFSRIVAKAHSGKVSDIKVEQFYVERFEHGNTLIDQLAI